MSKAKTTTKARRRGGFNADEARNVLVAAHAVRKVNEYAGNLALALAHALEAVLELDQTAPDTIAAAAILERAVDDFRDCNLANVTAQAEQAMDAAWRAC